LAYVRLQIVMWLRNVNTLQTGYPRVQALSQGRVGHAFSHRHMPHSSRSRLPARDGLRHCHMFQSSGPCLPTWEGSSAAASSTALDPTSQHGRARMLPHGSGKAVFPTAPGPAPPCGRAPVLPRTPRLLIPPPHIEGSGAATCPMALSRMRAMKINNKKPWLRS
jgi:hypothetical protein